MADRGDTHYRIPGLNKWFAFSSVALLIASVLRVLNDFNRPWKKYQREFREMGEQLTTHLVRIGLHDEPGRPGSSEKPDLRDDSIGWRRKSIRAIWLNCS